MGKEKLLTGAFENVEKRWMKFHVAVMALVTCIQLSAEIIMFFFLRETAATQIDTFSYLLTYVLLPSGSNLIMVLANLLIIYKTRLPHRAKVYTISLSFLLCIFIVTNVHNIFSSIYIVFLIPILLTTLYSSQILTAVSAALGTVLIFVSKITFADANPDTALEPFYDVNVLVGYSLFVSCYIVCVFIIHFEQEKHRMIMSQQVETSHLKTELMTDDLTGVNNKLALRERLAKITYGTKTTYHMAMTDIKNFASANDKYGHLTGDALLERFGQLLKQNVAKENIFRFGGDEFCILFENLETTEVIAKVNKICDDFKTFVSNEYHELDLTLKIGIASNYGLITGNALLEEADKALTLAKKSTTERIVFYKK